MNARAIEWFEDDDPRDLRRWGLAALIVVAIHLSAIAAYVYVHLPDDNDDDATAITVDFVPGEDAIDQLPTAPVPEQQQPEVEKPPPPDTAEAVVEPPPPPKIEEQ